MTQSLSTIEMQYFYSVFRVKIKAKHILSINKDFPFF